ncbi:MAG TPA: tail fiber domain-containing protein, partial [Bryobacteraceae bacterium]|nr:tail fiber domain-containing protein [Bryobacteraceae bacterium]
MASTANNQFIARATGGFFFQDDSSLDNQGGCINTTTGAYLTQGGVWTNNSDATLKENFTAVDGRAVLSQVARLPISTWNYKAEADSVRHMGPTAQDFYAAFAVGNDDRHIGTVDSGGVALAAIQGLNAVVEEKDARIAALEVRAGTLESQNGELEGKVAELASQNEELEARLAAVEAAVGAPGAQRAAGRAPAGAMATVALGLSLAGALVFRVRRGSTARAPRMNSLIRKTR